MMTSITTAMLVFACVFGAALLGMAIRSRLPEDHLSGDSKDVVKLAMGLIATMAALVLGLLTASAQNTWRTWDGDVKQSAADTILLDRTLAHFGPETRDIRAQLRAIVALRLARTWPGDGSAAAPIDSAAPTATVEGVDDAIRALTPQNDAQRSLQSRALDLSARLQAMRWALFAQSDAGIPTPFLVVVVLWLSGLAISFGLFAPRNGTVVAALLLCALAVSASIFLILELGTPLAGLMKISSVPLRYALSQLGQ